MLGAHIVFLHSGFGGFGSSRSARFYDSQPPFAWLFSTSISFLGKLEDSLVLNVVFSCDRPQFLSLRYAKPCFL